MVRSGDRRTGRGRRTVLQRRRAAPRAGRHQAASRALHGGGHVALSRVFRPGASTSHAASERGARGRARIGPATGARRRLCRADLRLAAAERHQHEAKRPLRRRAARLPRTPWFSSGTGELLGVALWNGANGPLNDGQRDKFKPCSRSGAWIRSGRPRSLATSAAGPSLSRRGGVRHLRLARRGERAHRRQRTRARGRRGLRATVRRDARALVRGSDHRPAGSGRPTRRSSDWRWCAISRTRSTMRASRAWCSPASRS